MSEPAGADRRPNRTVHGRRKGRPLRPGRKAVLAELLPRLEIRLPESGTLEPAALFDPPRPERIWLEIGFGAGEHLAWQAEHNPNVGLVGAEVFVNGIAGLLREVRDRGLTNVRVFQGDGRDLLAVLTEASLDRAFVLFPDPWPKTRHHKRRIVQPDTLDRLAAVMKDGVELRLATDDMAYLRWMLELLLRHPDFEWLARGPEDWRGRPADWPQTRYETKAIEQGRRPAYLRFRRRPRRA
ncbi:MAG TPA: tRNA (guanosine(46)-N7)-methyltransferase TrmB [Kiloniellales bacterium]|nr:tRNA (guanosine(46)-N7)-methyltransferase TrmB [Kiloniellales bacterium]